MASPIIGGIQQVGIGIPDVYQAWAWYRKAFRVDIPIVDDEATAELMLPYTGGQPRDRHAVLAMSMQGGGGLEIWQYTSRTPQPPDFDIQLGDLGIFALKIKSKDIQATHRHLQQHNIDTISEPISFPHGKPHFYMHDPYGNVIDVVPAQDWYVDKKPSTGGVYGCIIGVSDMNQSLQFYNDLLGYDTIVMDAEGVFEDFGHLSGGDKKFRRTIITHSKKRKGPFSEWIGKSELELVQCLDRTPRKMFENRLWGDLGYIHLCFDIQGMEAMKAQCAAYGHPFTVDSSAGFDMGDAAGHFSYIEDPDGTLIEFVEAHKIPIMKKMGWYLDLRKRDPMVPLPKWMLKTLSLNRKKD